MQAQTVIVQQGVGMRPWGSTLMDCFSDMSICKLLREGSTSRGSCRVCRMFFLFSLTSLVRVNSVVEFAGFAALAFFGEQDRSGEKDASRQGSFSCMERVEAEPLFLVGEAMAEKTHGSVLVNIPKCYDSSWSPVLYGLFGVYFFVASGSCAPWARAEVTRCRASVPTATLFAAMQIVYPAKELESFLCQA